MADVYSPEEEARINGYWGTGGSGGGLPAPVAPAPMPGPVGPVVDSAGGPATAPSPGAPLMSGGAPAVPDYWSGQPGVNMSAPMAPTPMGPMPPYGPVNPSPPMTDEERISRHWGVDSAGGPAPTDYASGAPGDSAGGPPPPQPLTPATPAPPAHVPNAAALDPAIRWGAELSMGPKVPKGASAEDNAAFASYMANFPKAKVAGGGGSSAKANPDPYGINAAQQGQLDALGDRASAIRRAADAAAVRATKEAEAQQRFARMQEEDAAIDRAQADLTQQHFDDSMREIGHQLDDVRAKKIDPFRLMHESPAVGVLAVIGSALGGFYQGWTGSQTNPFLVDLDRQLDRANAEDERQIRDNKFALEHGINLLAQQRAMQKDNDVARLQTRNLQYEAVKQQIAAEAASDSVPIDKAHADELISMVSLQQKQLQEEIGRRKQAQAAAAANQAFAAQKEVLAMYNNIFDKVLTATGSPEQAEAEASRQVGRMYAPGSVGPRPARTAGVDPVMSVPKGRQDEAAKELTHYADAEKSVGSVDSAFEKWRKLPITAGPWDRDREALQANILAAYKSGLGPGMSSDKDAEKFLEPLMPKTGDSDTTLKNKQALIASSIRSKVATPTLDAHAPGWRPPSEAEREAKAERVQKELNAHTWRGK